MFCEKFVLKNFAKFTCAQLLFCEFYGIFKNTSFNRTPLVAASAGLNKLGAQNFWDASNFSGAHIFPCKKEKILDLQVFSRMKKLQWVSNTTMDTSLLWWSLHIWRRQNCFIYSWIKKKSVVLSELFKHTWWYVWQKQLAALI